MSKGTYSFTTPIYYVNAAPHLGTAYTTVAADTVARYQRMNGYDVAFVTGMDEHGQKVADTAAAKGMQPQEWCDSMEPAFRDAWKMLDITYTDFVRTTEPRHARTVQKFWQDLYDKGWCYKGSYEGWYCVHEETYYAESDLEKNDDGEWVCPDCHRPVQKASGEENWFFKLSEFQQPLLKFYEEHPDFIRPETRRNEIVSFVERGLKDLSISRSTFDWGIPLPFDEGHVAYVWADALLAYLTGIGYGDEGERAGEFDQRWPMQYHFVGKDITRFHCVIWPAMLMAAGLPVTHTVFGHGFLQVTGNLFVGIAVGFLRLDAARIDVAGDVLRRIGRHFVIMKQSLRGSALRDELQIEIVVKAVRRNRGFVERVVAFVHFEGRGEVLRLGDHGDGHVADEYASLQSVFRIKFAQDVTHLFGRRPVVRNDVNGQSFGFERLFVGCHLGPAFPGGSGVGDHGEGTRSLYGGVFERLRSSRRGRKQQNSGQQDKKRFSIIHMEQLFETLRGGYVSSSPEGSSFKTSVRF